ncbi:hypothetical protein ACLK19_06010 [Escherichia coli]
MRRIRNCTVPNVPDVEVTAPSSISSPVSCPHIRKICSDGQIRQGLSAMVQLLEHYFSSRGPTGAISVDAAAGQQ